MRGGLGRSGRSRPVSPGASNGALSPRATRGTEGPELRWRLGFGRCLECHTSQPSNNGMGHPRAVKNLDDVISEIEGRLDEKDEVRELTIKSSRTIARLSGSAIVDARREAKSRGTLDSSSVE